MLFSARLTSDNQLFNFVAIHQRWKTLSFQTPHVRTCSVTGCCRAEHIADCFTRCAHRLENFARRPIDVCRLVSASGYPVDAGRNRGRLRTFPPGTQSFNVLGGYFFDSH